MKHRLFLVAAALFFSVLLGAGPVREGQTEERTRPLRLEIIGGLAAIQPHDLNLLADYYNAYPLFFYTRQYDYLRAQYGNLFSYAASRSGDAQLKAVRRGFPWGIRMRYSFSNALSLSLGLEHLEGNRLSSTSLRYQIEDRSGGLIQTFPREFTAGYPDFFLGFSAWIPQAGIHYAKPLGKHWQAVGSLSAGPMLARCRSVLETDYRYEYASGYRSENHYLLEMKGTGTGWAVDLGAELRRRLSRRWSFFLATGYAWRRAARIEGAGRSQSLNLDSNAVQDLVENSWQGRWRKKDAFFQRNWGQFTETYYGNYFSDGEAADNFVLDLSGVQLKIGLSWAL